VRDLAVLFLHLLATVVRLAGPGGMRSVVAESVLVKQQLLILNRSRKRSPNLRVSERLVAGLCALLMRPGRRSGPRSSKTVNALAAPSLADKTEISPAVLARGTEEAGPEGTTQEEMAAVVEMKRRNPTWGFAQQIALAFGIPINKRVGAETGKRGDSGSKPVALSI
jgi:putative transposase